MADISLRNITQNNLKGVDIKIPLGSFTVVCGPSGSGKSSLAFETLYAEGQRRYIESLNSYARQFLNKAPKPYVEFVENIPPAIALEQRNSVRNSRSTVGTSSDVLDYLRLLFASVGAPMCPNGHGLIERHPAAILAPHLVAKYPGKRFYLLAPIVKEHQILPDTKILKQFIADGYSRILSPKNSKKVGSFEDFGTVVDLNAKTKSSSVPKKDYYLVIDRFAVNPDDLARISDSLRQGYQASVHYNKNISSGQLLLVSTEGEVLKFTEGLTCNDCGFYFSSISPQLFSFNSPAGACPTCNGFGNSLLLDEDKIIPNPNLSIEKGALLPFTMPSAAADRRDLIKYCRDKGIDISTPWKDLPKKQRTVLWSGDPKFWGVVVLFEYLETKKYKMHVRVFLSRFKSSFPCKECHGGRLRPMAKSILLGGKSIQDITHMTVREALAWVTELPLSKQQKQASIEVYMQLHSRLSFLDNIGVHYLTLDRPTRTLSGGEFQRMMLAKQLGMGLCETLYVLDEPTIGLHPRDNERLIAQLKHLNSLGNTLVIVEHDEEVIKASERIIEMGPGSGTLGGEIVYSGETKDFLADKTSLTAGYIQKVNAGVPINPRTVDMSNYKYTIGLEGCTGNNLRNVDFVFPLNRIVTVTGVSGSGKSTLVTQTLYPALARALNQEFVKGQPFKKLTGTEQLSSVLYINQESVGRTERSNILTYLKIFDYVREIYSTLPIAKERGYTGGTFSLNVDGGRCPVCRGLGYEEIDMVFMDNLRV
ncbi:MAG: excinuclease ABC subunit UvrA, partial [Bdellovibrionaceae bacterium]|nr:excinuclease ABC subunit UvrA [Pseudobdellovibrionaceae bacterium]